MTLKDFLVNDLAMKGYATAFISGMNVTTGIFALIADYKVFGILNLVIGLLCFFVTVKAALKLN